MERVDLNNFVTPTVLCKLSRHTAAAIEREELLAFARGGLFWDKAVARAGCRWFFDKTKALDQIVEIPGVGWRFSRKAILNHLSKCEMSVEETPVESKWR